MRVRYIMGTSSTLFNGLLLELNSSSSDSVIVDALKSVLGDLGQANDDVSRVPNPFANWNPQPNPVCHRPCARCDLSRSPLTAIDLQQHLRHPRRRG